MKIENMVKCAETNEPMDFPQISGLSHPAKSLMLMI
jgi:hypothetical protein